MHPTEATVSESAGTASGMLLGGVFGGATSGISEGGTRFPRYAMDSHMAGTPTLRDRIAVRSAISLTLSAIAIAPSRYCRPCSASHLRPGLRAEYSAVQNPASLRQPSIEIFPHPFRRTEPVHTTFPFGTAEGVSTIARGDFRGVTTLLESQTLPTAAEYLAAVGDPYTSTPVQVGVRSQPTIDPAPGMAGTC